MFLLDVPLPADLDGRALTEVLREGPDPSTVEVRADPVEVQVELPGLLYHLTVERSRVDGVTYIDGARVERTPRP